MNSLAGNKIMFGQFPVERSEFELDLSKKLYTNKECFMGIGKIIFSIENKAIQFIGITIKQNKFDLNSEKYELKDIIKTNDSTYTFRGVNVRSPSYKITGILKTKHRNQLYNEVIYFEMSENGILAKGTFQTYAFPHSDKAKELFQKFGNINFGDSLATIESDIQE
jgi:hypothetical protein